MLLVTISAARISYPLPSNTISIDRSSDIPVFRNAEYISGNAGEPGLPGFSRTFLLPPDADFSTLTISVDNILEEVISGSFEISPIKPYYTSRGAVQSSDASKLRDGKAISIYAKDAYFPGTYARISSTGRMHEYNLVTVEVTPYRYNPLQKSLKSLKSGVVTIDYKQSYALQKYSIPWWVSEQAKRVAVNFDEMSQFYRLDRNREENIVILTTKVTVSGSKSLQSFIASKKKKGFGVTTVTEDAWGGSNMDKPDDIRDWLKANYQTKKIKYVLLIGDPTPNGIGDVPMKVALPQGTPVGSDCPTDYYFAELSGNWDLNGNSWVGEQQWDLGEGGPDKFSEVFVGRIPVYDKDYTTLDKILDKTIKYENAGPETIAWRKNILLPVEPSDFMTPGYQYCEAVKKDFADPAGWGSYRIYAQSYPDGTPDVSPTSISAVTTAWTTRHFGICDWNTHGNEKEAVKIMNSSTTSQLTNEYPSFVFQGSCMNAKPELSANLAYSLLKNGAIATVAATRLSLYEMGQTDPTIKKITNISMCYYFASFMITDKSTVGVALARLKNEIDGDFKGLWLNYCDYNVYGDPSIGIASMDGQMTGIHENQSPLCSWNVIQNNNSIQFTHPQTGFSSLCLTVYNVHGIQIYSHTEQNINQPVSLFWDKRESHGQRVSKGAYVYSIIIEGENGIISSTKLPLFIF